jgi:hypothetical protein
MEKELSRQRPLIFLQHNHLLLRIQFFALAIGQIYASTFRMAARLGCNGSLVIRSGDTRQSLPVAANSAARLRLLPRDTEFSNRFPTFIVRFRTVPAVVFADNGKSSPKKSDTLPNGNKAAILAVRYFSSGVVGFIFVKRVEKLRLCDPEHKHPLIRRTRIRIFPYTDRRVER